MDVLATALSALGAGPRQHGRLLRLHTPLGPEVLVAERLDGVEAVGPAPGAPAGYRLELTALSVDAHIDLAELPGQPVLLELLTAASRTRLRPFHGHVTVFERTGSNGGLARYRLVVEPWLALLRQRVDSYVFQDMTVMEIVESVFSDYVGQGALAPAWRWDLAEPPVYRKRSLATQYGESDLAFVERLLAEEGLFYWFEHSGAPGDDSLGAHTLVLADHNGAFSGLGPIRFHRSDVTEREDSLCAWVHARRWTAGRLRRASWDHRALDARPAEALDAAAVPVMVEDIDTAGPYRWPDRETGERVARRQLEALQVSREVVNASGSWRTVAAGGHFELARHPAYAGEEARFACIHVHHRARNNLGAEVWSEVERRLGLVALPPPPLPGLLDPGASTADASGDVDFYQARLQALPMAVPFRPLTADGHGLRIHPRPTVHGSQAAVVVADGGPLLTDRDHRVKVQFPWQRGRDGSSRLAHPGGGDNAPGNGSAGTWVRVATAWAGDNWGSVMLPRKGQEVLVAFLEGDIDRPVVVGSLYNGRGQADAPHNQVPGGAAGATGNAPAWFDGDGHPAVFTGFKSQALADSQAGAGGYQQLRLDDTPGQGRAEAATTQHDSRLVLGHLKAGNDNRRDAERGFGAELATAASGVVRAGAGLLLSADTGRTQLDAARAMTRLAQGSQLAESLDRVARQQGADLPEEPERLATAKARDGLQDTLAATAAGSAAGPGIGGGDGEVPGWSRPVLLGTSPDGIVTVTPADQLWVSGTHTSLDAAHDLQWLSQGEAVLAVAGGIALYTQGGAAPAGKPDRETGIALHAAQGRVSARAASNLAEVAAQQSVTIASTTADVQVGAPNKYLLATAAGAYLKLEGGDIEIGAPGTVEFRAAKKEWMGAQADSGRAPVFGTAEPKLCELGARQADAGGAGVVPLG
ncbi:type VI secretion system tip protein VgrG [Lysobacter sp. GX 14042]|uniref:type VI secretion system Vgr family protein n=1 Tax=Lysobacter sp. GX 14042 TaxID=2907155 RepID=UPI001F315AFD|nr:type VI secretion system Vgr family protein [Lysobacter sp. GX 14042]MCE7032255.1 type VI secretion system tip protein VgrG [Lysobacter sp. GX 14042]